MKGGWVGGGGCISHSNVNRVMYRKITDDENLTTAHRSF